MQPVRALLGINGGTLCIFHSLVNSFIKAFKQFEGYKIPLLPYKLMYAAIQSVILGIGGYRLYTMGLLPLSPADYVDLIPRRTVNFFSMH